MRGEVQDDDGERQPQASTGARSCPGAALLPCCACDGPWVACLRWGMAIAGFSADSFVQQAPALFDANREHDDAVLHSGSLRCCLLPSPWPWVCPRRTAPLVVSNPCRRSEATSTQGSRTRQWLGGAGSIASRRTRGREECTLSYSST